MAARLQRVLITFQCERTRKTLLGDRFGGLLTEPEPMVPVPSACDDRVVGLSLDRVTSSGPSLWGGVMRGRDKARFREEAPRALVSLTSRKRSGSPRRVSL